MSVSVVPPSGRYTACGRVPPLALRMASSRPSGAGSRSSVAVRVDPARLRNASRRGDRGRAQRGLPRDDCDTGQPLRAGIAEHRRHRLGRRHAHHERALRPKRVVVRECDHRHPPCNGQNGGRLVAAQRTHQHLRAAAIAWRAAAAGPLGGVGSIE